MKNESTTVVMRGVLYWNLKVRKKLIAIHKSGKRISNLLNNPNLIERIIRGLLRSIRWMHIQELRLQIPIRKSIWNVCRVERIATILATTKKMWNFLKDHRLYLGRENEERCYRESIEAHYGVGLVLFHLSNLFCVLFFNAVVRGSESIKTMVRGCEVDLSMFLVGVFRMKTWNWKRKGGIQISVSWSIDYYLWNDFESSANSSTIDSMWGN